MSGCVVWSQAGPALCRVVCLSSVDFGFFASPRKGVKLALWNVMANYLALPLSYVTLEFRGGIPFIPVHGFHIKV